MAEQSYSLARIAEHVGAELFGHGEQVIFGPASIEQAGPGQITFAESLRYENQIRTGSAGAILVGADFPIIQGRNLLRATHPRSAFLKVMELFVPVIQASGIDSRAVIDESVELGPEVSIGPCAVVAADAQIGARSRIHAGAVIGASAQLGEDCEVFPNATLYPGVQMGNRCVVHAGATIGGDGFGYQWLGDHHHKIPQLGSVRIEDDVEIGCNSCVDRATLGETRIGRGTKIDNQVHIGHNNSIGEHAILLAQVAVAGSVKVGDGAILAGQAGVSDHLIIGAGARVGAAAGVTRNVPANSKIWGTPGRPLQRVLKELAALARLPDLLSQFTRQSARISELERRLAELDGR
jgi:UDP-3-O-[3-hydroxymyristoyl] glucosamine N-acyltransferase